MTNDLRELSRRFQNYAEEIESQLPDTCVLSNETKLNLAFALTNEPNSQTKLLQDYLRHRKRFAKKIQEDSRLAYSLILLLRFYAGTLKSISNLFPSDDDSEILNQLCSENHDAFSKTLRAVELHLGERPLPSDTPNNPQ